jgi:hypothetical protein
MLALRFSVLDPKRTLRRDVGIRLLILSGSLSHLKVLGLRQGRGVSSGAHMRRREFIAGISGVAVALPLAARAQQPAGRVYRVGYLASGSQQPQLYLIKAFDEGLRSLGYRVGQNIVIEYRFADGEVQRLPALAAELVRLGAVSVRE